MSYILEALKKAEQQRRLGKVPDIYTPSIGNAMPAGEEVKRYRLHWPIAAAALLLSLAGVLTWLKPWNAAISKPQASAAHEQVAMNNAGQIQQPPSLPLQSSSTTTAPIQSEGKPSPTAAPNESATAALSRRETVEEKIPARPAKKTKKSKEAKDERATQSAGAAQAGTSHQQDQEAHLPTQHELPEILKQQVPAMTVNGYIYANNPAERSIVINNQLLHEGEQLSPGLILEKMKPKEVIMNYKGTRYRVLY